MNLRPLNDRVIVKEVAEPTVSPGGIEIPDVAREKPQHGEVIAVGPGEWTATGGTLVNLPIPVFSGQRVLFAKYSGIHVKEGNEELLILRASDIIAVIEGDDQTAFGRE